MYRESVRVDLNAPVGMRIASVTITFREFSSVCVDDADAYIDAPQSNFACIYIR